MEILAGRRADGLMQSTLAQCIKELLVTRPAPLPLPEAHLHSEPLRRGVQMRALYHHAARTSRGVRDCARAMSELGAQLRTAERLPGEVVVVDRRMALLDHGPSKIIVISEPRLVNHFIDVFEQLWEGGWAFPAVATRNATPAGTSPRPAILRLLSEGAKDEQVARRLGLSLRTCRRHIADMMSQVGATSRFQAGVLTARGGLLGLPAVPEERDSG